ncbi:MAG: acyl-CoA dehydrogenase, partial [Actinobacteria bacterium]|nr:acyl-CoA dehydrogenase [Actinomycetota bacterium]
FTQDWPLEQYVRDAKIDTLYEGTTAIQGLDFFFRKIIKDNGRALTKLAKEMGAFVASGGNNATEKAVLGKALEEMQAIIGLLVTHALASQEKPDEIYKCGLNTTRLLMSVGDVIISWLLLRQADIAATKIGSASGKDKDFYEGKIAASRYFIHNFLPLISATRAIVEREDGEIMKVSEGAF